MTADRRHLHHLLLDFGLGVGATVWVLAALSLAFSTIGILGWLFKVPDYWLFWSLVLIFVIYAVFSIGYWRHKKVELRPAKATAAAVNDAPA